MMTQPRVIRGDARDLKTQVGNGMISCIVTSPPYNVNIDYPGYDDNLPWDEYADLVAKSCKEMYRTLRVGGRVWVNIMPTAPIENADNGQRRNLANLWSNELTLAGLSYRDTITWIQDAHDGACAWGSWLRPSAPNLRGGSETILLFFKEQWKREAPSGYELWQAPRKELGGDWPELCRNVWHIKPARRFPDAPAPFPIELPARAIRLSTWPGEFVLDPFAGSGTTLRAAQELGRQCYAFDIGA